MKSGKKKTESGTTPPSFRILVVDDYPDAAQLVAELLERLGHTVRIAHSAVDALSLTPEFKPDVAFLDVGLPCTDGFQLAAALRATREGRRCRMIGFSGYNDPRDRRQSIAAGFQAFLIKPVSEDTLVEVLRGVGDEVSRSA